MRIVLLYPPPWKIPAPGQPPYPAGEGPPKNLSPQFLDAGDFNQAPYGLLSLAAQAAAAGHQVRTLNLSTFPWREVASLTHRLPAELYGLSCHTANRRGVALLARHIRERHPAAHIVVGGPHVTALPREILVHHDAIDTVVMGEGEASFMELVQRLEAGRATAGIPGTAWRTAGRVEIGPPRPPIADLDALASPADRFPLRTLVTSRGCPGRCTFCASPMMWGGRLRLHSAAFVLNMIENAVARCGLRHLAFKDDTFTADRRRALAICEEILRRQLRFDWSCETRADRLDDALLKIMRRAGCRRISIGVESASPEILLSIRKKISPQTVLNATRMARSYGIEVRFYMMVGNRGETYRTFRQSLDFIQAARPNRFVFCQLHLYPGTQEFEIFQRQGCVTPEIFFTSDTICLTCFGGEAADLERIMPELKQLQGVKVGSDYGVDDYERVLRKLPDLASAHMDLCAACLRNGRLDRAESCLRRATELQPTMPALVHNLEACLAAARNQFGTVRPHLEKAVEIFPHRVVLENMARYGAWQQAGGEGNPEPLELAPDTGFETYHLAPQPEGPGPIDPTEFYF